MGSHWFYQFETEQPKVVKAEVNVTFMFYYLIYSTNGEHSSKKFR